MEIIENFIKRSIVPFDDELKKLESFSKEIHLQGDDACPMRQLIILIRFIEKCTFPVITTTNAYSRVLHYNKEFVKELDFLSMCNASIKLNVLSKHAYVLYKDIFKREIPNNLIYSVFYKIDKVHEAVRTCNLTYTLNTNDLIIVFDKQTPNSKTLILTPNHIIITDKFNFYRYEGNLS